MAKIREQGNPRFSKADAIKLTETLHHYYDQMIQLQSEQDTAINITVNEINDIVKNIRDLNEQIFRFEIGGEKANDLGTREILTGCLAL